MPYRPSCSATFRLMATTAALRTPLMMPTGMRAAMPTTLMIRPQPWRCMYGATSRMKRV
jgi:hypothetical protein